jgi:opacity protein-like surface antigen
MRIRALLGMAVLVAVPSLPAFAQVWNTGVYAELNGGAVMVGEANDVAAEVVGDAGDALPELGRDWEFTLGAGGAAGIGYDFGVIRLDGGVTYLSTGIRISRKGILDEDANEDTFTLLAATGNAWYDIDTGSPWTLYFGGGFGTANLGIHLVDIDVKDLDDEPDYTFSTWSLAFQAGAGIGYTIADFMVIDLGYRLLGAIDPELVKLGSLTDKGNFRWPLEPGTLLTHRIGIGMRIIFL